MLRTKFTLSLLTVFLIFNKISTIMAGHVRLALSKRSLEDEMNRLTKHYQIISRDNKECSFNSEEEKKKYRIDSVDSQLLGDLNKWTGKVVHDTHGPYYIFTDKQSGLVLEADLQNGGRVYLGSPYNEGSMQHWKLSFCGEDQICLLHRLTEKYLSFKTVGTCYAYILSTEKTPFYLRW